MTIKVKFALGPLDGKVANVRDLPQCQIFFDIRQKQVFCYNRIDELVYVYEQEVSQALTEQYDKALEKFGKGGESVESWDGTPQKSGSD